MLSGISLSDICQSLAVLNSYIHLIIKQLSIFSFSFQLLEKSVRIPQSFFLDMKIPPK